MCAEGMLALGLSNFQFLLTVSIQYFQYSIYKGVEIDKGLYFCIYGLHFA